MPTASNTAESPRVPRDPRQAEMLAIVEHLAERMADCWRKGERPLAEEYLARHPELWNLPEAALELISEEICLRHETGQPISAADFTHRFPQWRREVLVLLSCHSLLKTHLPAPRFPLEGEALGEFRLVAELGRGAHARVFLATQPALADRPVVLKLTPCVGREHLCLARLQHTHIVPLYSVHHFPERQLRALCLPYFGGVTLARLLEMLRERPPEQRTGGHIADALQRSSAGGIVGGPACRFLARASYTQAICWIGASLADALQYAQERGLVHLDVKPANVLLAADSQPMLLDFHVARPPITAGDSAPGWLGGTPGYMAPEHEAAVTAVREGRPVPGDVDGRADIYALGVLMYEALSGSLPELTRTPASSLRRKRQVTRGLANLLAKCLAADPALRYSSGAALASDLRRYLADLPMREVANGTPAERWRKWQRRHPYRLVLCGLLLILTLGGGLLLAQAGHQAKKAEAALREGQESLQQGRYAEASNTLNHGLTLIEGLPFCARLTQRLRDGIDLAERARAAGELHLFAESIRPLYGADHLPAAQAQAVEMRCREIWEKRDLVLRQLSNGGTGPVAQLDEQVQIDLLDLAIVATNLRVRSAPADDVGGARHRALNVLAEAEKLLGPSCVLYHERATQARALGLDDMAEVAMRQADSLTPRTAWEHFALGRAYFLGSDVRRAAGHIERALELQPQNVWANFYKGCCAYRLGEYTDAVIAFSICVALAPDSAWCLHNRGLAYRELGRLDQALHDFNRALALDSSLAAAALSRGVLHYRQQHYEEALADLQRALNGGLNRTAVYYNQALVHLARKERAAAINSLQNALQHDPHHQPSKQLLAQLGGTR